ncbi:hypothetical protein C8721_000181 [Salmonella enterica subsp. enterica serovar Berta]|nr:hypothetical protein [Salmonella enterica subsp. enterica serovar Berta]
MQPTKKRAIAKCVITAAAIGLTCAAATEAGAYEPTPKTLWGPQVNTSITTKVTNALMTPIVDWEPAEPEATAADVTLGSLKIHAAGTGIAPEAYVVAPCNGQNTYTVTINDEDAGEHFVVYMEGGARVGSGSPEYVLDASPASGHDANIRVKLNKAPMAGEYRTCVGVTAIADDITERQPD